MRERRVGEGERGEMRGGDRKGGRSLGVRRHTQNTDHTPTRVGSSIVIAIYFAIFAMTNDNDILAIYALHDFDLGISPPK